jgi:hypothetical protein
LDLELDLNFLPEIHFVTGIIRRITGDRRGRNADFLLSLRSLRRGRIIGTGSMATDRMRAEVRGQVLKKMISKGDGEGAAGRGWRLVKQ